MVRVGNFFFRTRNYLFPLFYFILFLPFARTTGEYTIVFYLGLGVAIAGQAIRMLTIGLVYIIRGGKNKRIYAEGLVTNGLFSHCRNPMYLGNILLITGMSILSNSMFALVIMVPLFIFIYQAITRAEEAFLGNKFGKGYKDYCDNVPRWLPQLNGIKSTLTSNTFHFKKVLFKEYNTTYLWTLGATLLFAYNYFWFASQPPSFENVLPFVVAVVFLSGFYCAIRYFKKKEMRSALLKVAESSN